MAVITNIDKRGIAKELRLKSGDEVLSFNNKPFLDMLDYYYYDGQDKFVMTVRRGKKIIEFEVEKGWDETLGLEFDDSVEIKARRCKNKCKFCFVDQLPKGMRETLYVKDDDYRLSFISGNYITLTNVSEEELNRIVDMRLSPLYISVHATDASVKVNLVTNPDALNTYAKMRYLKDNGIDMHAQIVMCEGINDRLVLSASLSDLCRLAPELRSVAVVPCGLTGHREGLYPLKEVAEDTAKDAIERINVINSELGYNFAFASDEMYLKANAELPDYSYYHGFEQLENGVGLMRMFESELDNRISERIADEVLEGSAQNLTAIDIDCVTGVSFGEFLTAQMKKVNAVFPNVNIRVNIVKNNFFGESITVAGLLTGGDIVSQLSGTVGANLVLPSNILREFTESFLDDMRVPELEKKLNTKLHISRGGGSIIDIIESLIER